MYQAWIPFSRVGIRTKFRVVGCPHNNHAVTAPVGMYRLVGWYHSLWSSQVKSSMSVIVSFPVTMVNTMTKSYLSYFSLIDCSPSLREIQAGTDVETIKECCLPAYSPNVASLKPPKPTCLGLVPPTMAWALPHQISDQENRCGHRYDHRLILRGKLNWSSLFPGVSSWQLK